MTSSLPHKIFIGHDPREQRAYDVAVASLQARVSEPVHVTPLKLDVLHAGGLLWRRTERMKGGSLWDTVSKTPTSTEFSISRFLIPLLVQSGWVLFTDPDVVFLRDVAELFALADDRYAVMCVKHDYRPVEMTKMDGALQRAYRRKNWASVVLWNADHEAHKRLDLKLINTWPRDLLSQFSWLLDEEIGELPPAWNWLVNVQPRPEDVGICHYTLGGPWLPDWQAAPHDEIWMQYARELFL